MIEMRWVENNERIEVDDILLTLQYRQQEEDWGGHNDTPDLVWGEWVDVESGGSDVDIDGGS